MSSLTPCDIRTNPNHTGTVPAWWSGCETPYPSHRNIAQLFEDRAERTPEAVAISWGTEKLTYGELNMQANQLARVLRSNGVGLETVVAVHLERSPRIIVALLAVSKAGGTYLPLDTTYPAERLTFMLQDTAAAVVLTESSTAGLLPVHGARTVSFDRDSSEIARQSRGNLAHVATGESRVYIMYTSGSTGQPKGIEILHRGIARLVLNCNEAQIVPGDSVAQLANCSFDASTWEIWGALLNGARLVGVEKELALSPRKLAGLLDTERITVMFLTTALFNLMAKEVPTAFRNVRHLLTGGEAMVPDLARTVLEQGPPANFYNVYGPTECTSYATWYRMESVAQGIKSVPIGRPLQNTVARVLDANMQACAIGETGELYIGGDGLARGYLNRPELTTERFVVYPMDSARRLYKTGDLVRWLETGVIDFVGRADLQVKIRGFRIEPGEVQAVLFQHPEVCEAFVLVREETPGDKRIVCYLVPQNREAAIGAKSQLDRLTSDVCAAAKRSLPAWMIPTVFTWVEALPLTPNGKVDRAALTGLGVACYAGDQEAAEPATQTEKVIAPIWKALLNVSVASVHHNFFDLGGDSMLAAQLVLRVSEAFGVEFPIGQFFENATIAQLAHHIDVVRLTGKAALTAHVDFMADTVLPAEVVPEASWDGRTAENVFLTGATGFLGAYLLEGLLRRTSAKVFCLVRATNEEKGVDRLRATLRKYGLSAKNLQRVVPVLGDLTKPSLGMDETRFMALACEVDAIYHAAAHVSYVEPYALHKPANVDGTLEVLRLACKVVAKPLHYVSSIGIFGPVGYFQGVTDINEDTDIDASEKHLQLDMGYSMSKWVAEKLVFAARDRGLPVAIYRPGFIMGHSRTGATNPDDFMSRLMAGCIAMGSYPFLPDQRKEFVPVDYVASALLHTSRNPAALGGVFHLTQPDARQSVDFLDFFETIEELGYNLRMVSYTDWKAELWEHVRTTVNSPLLPLLTVLTEKVHNNTLTRWEVHEKMPRFHSHNTNAMLQGSGITCETMNRKVVAVYLEYLATLGMIPTPQEFATAACGSSPELAAHSAEFQLAFQANVSL